MSHPGECKYSSRIAPQETPAKAIFLIFFSVLPVSLCPKGRRVSFLSPPSEAGSSLPGDSPCVGGWAEKNPSEFASLVEKGKNKRSTEAGHSRRTVWALCVAFSGWFTRVACIGLIAWWWALALKGLGRSPLKKPAWKSLPQSLPPV